jgi:hypothetical protein
MHYDVAAVEGGIDVSNRHFGFALVQRAVPARYRD